MSGERHSDRGLILDRPTSERLAKIRQRNTSPELKVRSLLQGLGLRFRVGRRGLPGSPDIVNLSRRWVVLVHGCFWHAHEGCGKATVPKRNREFWLAKFAANQTRDGRVVRELEDLGFKVVVIWECEVESRPDAVARRLARELVPRGRREADAHGLEGRPTAKRTGARAAGQVRR